MGLTVRTTRLHGALGGIPPAAFEEQPSTLPESKSPSLHQTQGDPTCIDYDEAIASFVGKLGFELVEDSPATTDDGRIKRWVAVRPPAAATGLLVAQADGDQQQAVVGRQHGGRIGFFLHVDDFDAAHARPRAAGVEFETAPRDQPFGRVAIFRDVVGNRWDMIGPAGP